VTHPNSTIQALRAFESKLKNSSKITIRYALVRAARDLGIYNAEIEFVPWHTVNVDALQDLVIRWASEMAGTTLKLHLSALRGIFRSCLAHGLITHQKYFELSQIDSTVFSNAFSSANYVEEHSIRMLIESCVNDERRTLATRDQALISLLFGTVMGRAEAVNIRFEDLDLKQRKIRIHDEDGYSAARVLSEWAVPPLQEWLDVLAAQGQHSGPVLRRVSNGGRALDDMKAGGLYKALINRCVTAGVQIIKPRDARRTVATDLINGEGTSLSKITLGNSCVTATLQFRRFRGE